MDQPLRVDFVELELEKSVVKEVEELDCDVH